MKYIEFDNHDLVSQFFDRRTGLEGYIALHRVTPHTPAFGATRMVAYPTVENALRDALRLSKMMSYKAALAGLPYGGGKGVILASPKARNKQALLKAYCDRVNYLSGHFITGADVGLDQADISVMSGCSRHIVGSKSDPVKFTTMGVFQGWKICLKTVFGTDSLAGRSILIQGAGKIGAGLVAMAYGKAKKIMVADVDPTRVKLLKKRFPAVEIIKPADIIRMSADIFAPCALNHTLNSKSISRLKVAIVAGGANNQLEDQSIGQLLHKLGILYAPDYVVNSGGLISVVDEYQHGRQSEQRVLRRLKQSGRVLEKIINISQRQNRATNLIADALAEKIFNHHR